jgi:hypothetical protein
MVISKYGPDNYKKIIEEAEYQHIKKAWYFDESSYLHQTVDDNGKAVDIIKEYGCGHWSNKDKAEGGERSWCVPECEYFKPCLYPELFSFQDGN